MGNFLFMGYLCILMPLSFTRLEHDVPCLFLIVSTVPPTVPGARVELPVMSED